MDIHQLLARMGEKFGNEATLHIFPDGMGNIESDGGKTRFLDANELINLLETD